MWNLEGNMRLYLSNAELIEFYPSKYLDEFCKQTKVKLIDVYNDYLDSYKAIRYDKLKIGTKYFPNHFIPIIKNISIKNIIRKTKCFRIWERNAIISKTKRNFSRLYPTPQNFKKIDRLRRNEIHLKAVRTPS